MNLRSSFSPAVADRVRAGASLHDALRDVLGSTPAALGVKTSDVLADLEALGAWSPHSTLTDELRAREVTVDDGPNGIGLECSHQEPDALCIEAADRIEHLAKTVALFKWVRDNLLNESQLATVPPGYDKALRHL